MEEKNSKCLTEYVGSILNGSRTGILDIGELDIPFRELGQELNMLAQKVEEMRAYSAELSKGNLAVDFPASDNILCESLKNLHVNLKLLSWQAGQMAKGNYSSRASYLGGLSDSLNEIAGRLKEKETWYKEEMQKAKSHAESIEGYNELLIGMLSKRNEWLLVVDIESKEILYCNKKNADGTAADTSFCETCKRRLSFQGELLEWGNEEQYHVWETSNGDDRDYRITSFMIEWKGRSSGVHIVVDITEEKMAARKLTSKAYNDAGTGIRNRQFFEEYMEILLREKKEATLCYFDLDGLKYVNDTFGHMEGDMYIQYFVELIKRNFRTDDTFARTGGDEFCLVLAGCIKDLMDRKMEEILKEFQAVDNGSYQCSFSYGIVEIHGQDNTLSLDEIIHEADAIMYECKRQNKEKYPNLAR